MVPNVRDITTQLCQKWLSPVNVQSAAPILTNGTLKDRMGPCASTVTGFQLDPMPRGIGIEEKQKELFAAI